MSTVVVIDDVYLDLNNSLIQELLTNGNKKYHLTVVLIRRSLFGMCPKYEVKFDYVFLDKINTSSNIKYVCKKYAPMNFPCRLFEGIFNEIVSNDSIMILKNTKKLHNTTNKQIFWHDVINTNKQIFWHDVINTNNYCSSKSNTELFEPQNDNLTDLSSNDLSDIDSYDDSCDNSYGSYNSHESYESSSSDTCELTDDSTCELTDDNLSEIYESSDDELTNNNSFNNKLNICIENTNKLKKINYSEYKNGWKLMLKFYN